MDDRMLGSRLRWRCRRGVRELDVLLERFLEADALNADEARVDFELLLEQADPLLVEWLILGARPPARLEGIVERVRAHAFAAPG